MLYCLFELRETEPHANSTRVARQLLDKSVLCCHDHLGGGRTLLLLHHQHVVLRQKKTFVQQTLLLPLDETCELQGQLDHLAAAAVTMVCSFMLLLLHDTGAMGAFVVSLW